MEQARARNDEEDNPADRAADAQIARETTFAAAKSEQDDREQIRSGADQEIANAGDDRAEWADEILRRPVRRRGRVKEREPGRDILRDVGNQREKKQRPDAEQNQSEDFVPCIVAERVWPLRLIVIARVRLSIPLFAAKPGPRQIYRTETRKRCQLEPRRGILER